jgi:phosphopantothenoylcysteine decarboxylase/phosphopantothenate--cysteine ligase
MARQEDNRKHRRTIRILITAGGTREYIDPVRFISNASSGRMGYALVRAAMKSGHRVTLVTAPTALKAPPGAAVVRVQTAAEMFEAVKKRFPRCDCLIMAAAVSDYTPVKPSKTKLKKQAAKMTLELKPTPDILKWAGSQRRVGSARHHRKIIVGFALEDRDLRASAERKMREKRLDMIVANTPGAIGAEASTLHIKAAGSDWVEIGHARKARSAYRIIRLVETLRQRSE